MSKRWSLVDNNTFCGYGLQQEVSWKVIVCDCDAHGGEIIFVSQLQKHKWIRYQANDLSIAERRAKSSLCS